MLKHTDLISSSSLHIYFEQIESEFLISGDRYDGREDFTVVLQPYLHSSFVPYVGVSTPAC